MPRFSIGENSSSSSDGEGNRMPKRRRIPFPSRVLYRHGNSSTHPAAIAAAGLRRITSTTTPAGAAGAAGASTSQPDSDDSSDFSESDSSDDDDVPIRLTKPAVTSGAVVVGRGSDLNKVVSKDVVQSGSGGSTSERVAAILTDTDVLDCAICFEPFTIPVYQCDNGHTACSSCCGKLRNKCPSCCSPIGYNRCRALEKVLEAAKITCSNSKYGCKEKVSYSMKRASMKFKFLQAQDNTLFVLNCGVQTIGNVANIICIGPSSLQKVFSYELEASNADSTVKLTSLAHSQPKWTAGLPQKSVLVIPKVFIGPSGEHNIQVCIRRKVEK
ncbi:RING-type E3 ubiquitin transferase [Heracleum sosnowskyi]|uniref:RING-type E3 ubiquitin transferase n=1 Tax=Heracleum sosnowskyi TaxID=360622 RepID=A0AAD8H9Y5_9APIA|nr:RING-type E3 ubiquitin transferase [Heracleum sosnowskyi]